jgi:hypothetical protein
MEPDGGRILMSSCAFRGEPFIHRLGFIHAATGAASMPRTVARILFRAGQ